MTGAWRWSLVGVAIAGFALASLPVLLFWSQLPEPIAVHWSIDLRPDGRMAKQSGLLVNAALVGGSLLLTLVGAAGASRRGRAIRLMMVTLIGTLATIANVTIVGRNLGKAVWTDAESLTAGALLLQVCLPIAAAVAAYFIGLRVWRAVQAPAAASARALSLSSGARAFWTGSATNRWLLVTGGALLAQGIVLFVAVPRLRLLPVLLVVHALALIVLELFSVIRVIVDSRGVAVRYGHLGLWTRRVPLGQIVAAHALKLDALEHGGWGYRGGLRLFGKAAIVVRSGDALRLELGGGKQLFITVDDAATAARLLNALIERQPPAANSAEQNEGAPRTTTQHAAHDL